VPKASVGAIALFTVLTIAACATTSGLRLPTEGWLPESAARRDVEAALTACRGVRTYSAEVGVSGRVAGTKLRGRVLAGFTRGGQARLEAPAPFGAPVFILTARGGRAAIWFPRDRRVLPDAAFEDVLEALIGVRRTPDDLMALLAGCVSSARSGSGAPLRHPAGWLQEPLADGSVAYLRRDGGVWRVAGGDAASWGVRYDYATGAFPGLVALWRSGSAASPAGLASSVVLRISQTETNVDIADRAFDAAAPPGASMLSLEDLRQMGPLADRATAREHQP
jgi:hypothetical protein